MKNMNLRGLGCATLLSLVALLSACGGGSSGTSTPTPPPGNSAPVANAGAAQSVNDGTTVTLDASASTDVNADALTYIWALTSKPAGSAANLSSPTAVKPTFVADVAGSYVASLVVNDGKLNSSNTATITITAAVLNLAPVANAGNAQNVNINAVVALTGAASTDANGDAITYAWTLTSLPAGSIAVLANATTVAPSFTADKAGAYTASLIVSDGKLSSSAVTVTVTATLVNVAPVAQAGAAQNIITNSVVNLDGSGSSDADGNSLIYKWSFSSIPTGSTASLSNVGAIKPTFTADKSGTYVLQLIVNDGLVDSSPATVTINAAVNNVAPVANAGSAQSIKVGETANLDGTGSTDSNGDSLTYSWTLSSKPVNSLAVLSGPTSSKPSFTADLSGSYVAQLVVSDGIATSNLATVTITAVAPNVAPVAVIKVVPTGSVIQGTLIALDGTLSTDANLDPLIYSWVLTSLPSGSGAVLSNRRSPTPSFVADLKGDYVVQLVVDDGKVLSNAAKTTVTAIFGLLPVGNTGKLNDTGITNSGYDAAGNFVTSCALAAANNDCKIGLDATVNDDRDGHAGSNFTKIAADGSALPASAESWSCVKDNVTGLIWENKTLANKDVTYTAYGDNRVGDISAYKNSVNVTGLCAAKDWRLPTVDELFNITDLSVSYPGPVLDSAWFTNTGRNAYWSATRYAADTTFAWRVVMVAGVMNSGYQGGKYAVRLVRSSAN